MTTRDCIRPPKFADKFAALDFEAEPLPVISMFPEPDPCVLEDISILIRGEDLKPRTLGWCDLASLPERELEAPLICQIFNWYEVARWRGVRFRDFLDAHGLEAHPEGFYVFHSRDGQYFEVLSRDEARDPRTMLAFGLNGGPLPQEYGGPVRLVVPFLQGYKSVKWIASIQSFRHDPAGIKRLLGQSKSGALGQAWAERFAIEPAAPSTRPAVVAAAGALL
jgi:DMSO/TMAO reductase YedYZ molybdopterin-dependent catalytic subunit